MKITDELNLALPVGDGSMMAYHTPISRDVYELHYSVLNAAKASMVRKGIQYQMGQGPRIANLVLKDEGLKDAAERGDYDEKGNVVDEKTPALLDEIKRLTVGLVPAGAGYEMLPIEAAIAQGKIDREDWSELESAIVFFTCHVMPARKMNRVAIGKATASVLSGSTTSSSPMDFAASLQTSTNAEPTPPPVATSSLPV